MLEPPRSVRRVEVITGGERRRRWSAAEKARIVAEAMAPGAVVSEVARRHDLWPQHLFGWIRAVRRADAQERLSPPLFVPALVEAPEPSGGSAARLGRADRGRSAGSGIEMEMAGAVVRIGPDASETAITAVIRALKGTP